MTKAAKPNPFIFLDAITWSKDNTWGERSEENYVAFLINRHFSQFPDTVHYANDLNMRHDVLAKQLQFEYLINSLPKRKRFGKWKKKEDNADIKLVSKFLGINEEKAEEILPLVSKSRLNEMRQQYEQPTGRSARNLRRSKA